MTNITFDKIFSQSIKNVNFDRVMFPDVEAWLLHTFRQMGCYLDNSDIAGIKTGTIDVNNSKYDYFIRCFWLFFELDQQWVEQIRKQTVVKKTNNRRTGYFF